MNGQFALAAMSSSWPAANYVPAGYGQDASGVGRHCYCAAGAPLAPTVSSRRCRVLAETRQRFLVSWPVADGLQSFATTASSSVLGSTLFTRRPACLADRGPV